MTPTPEGAALIAHREAAAAELDLPVGDPLAIQYGALRAAHDLCQLKITEGALSAVPDLIRLHDAMAEIKKLVPPKPISVTLTIVRPTDAAPPRSASVGGLRACRRCGWVPPNKDRVVRCYRCNWRRGDDTSAPLKPIDIASGSPSVRASEVTPDVRAPAAPADNVVPLQPPRRDPGSIHDAPGARLAPSRRRMPLAPDFEPVGFSTWDLPERERLSRWREEFGRGMVGVDIEPVTSDQPFYAEATLQALPGVRTALCAGSLARLNRTHALAADGGDSVGLIVNLGAKANVSQRGGDVTLDAGDAILMTADDAGILTSTHHFDILLPRGPLAARVRNLDGAIMRPIPRSI